MTKCNGFLAISSGSNPSSSSNILKAGVGKTLKKVVNGNFLTNFFLKSSSCSFNLSFLALISSVI